MSRRAAQMCLGLIILGLAGYRFLPGLVHHPGRFPEYLRAIGIVSLGAVGASLVSIVLYGATYLVVDLLTHQKR